MYVYVRIYKTDFPDSVFRTTSFSYNSIYSCSCVIRNIINRFQVNGGEYLGEEGRNGIRVILVHGLSQYITFSVCDL